MGTKTPPAGEHLPFIDVLRGMAILSVFGYHCLGTTFGAQGDSLPWNGWVRSFDVSPMALAVMPLYVGWVGVTLFFVISGFCIHLSHVRARDKGWDVFFIRRFFRIYPPFLLALLIFAACRLNFHHQFWASLTDFTTHLFLLNNFLWGPGGINGSFWSIATEVQLYLIYPFLLAIASRLGWRKTLWVTGAILAFFLIGEPLLGFLCPDFVLPPGVNRSPIYYWYIWSLGAALADAYTKGEPLPFRKVPFYVWLALGAACYFFRPVVSLSAPLLALGCASVIALGLERPGVLSPVRSALWKPLATVGLVSYSAYLLHQPLLKMLMLVAIKAAGHHALPEPVLFAMSVSTFAIIFPIAYAFYRLIELPSIELGKWVIRKRKNAQALLPASPVPSAES